MRRVRGGRRGALGGLLAASCAWVLAPSPADACSAPQPIAPIGLPRPATVGVSTATSLIVLSRGEPAGLSLLAGGQNVALAAPVNLGQGADHSTGPVTFWQVRSAAGGMLAGDTEHVLTATFQGSSVEVTHFTTAAGYDKVEGVAPVLKSVRLWRVRYPVADINSGNCVFAEYHGFITVDYDPGTVPNTAPSSVVHTFRLAPKTGGSEQHFLYTGETPFTGLEPKEAYPTPIGAWQPELDPTRTYCLSVAAFGDGDMARLSMQSESLCTDVVQLSATGAPPSGGGGGGGSGGCSIAGAAGGKPRAAAVLLLAAVAIRLRRRRRR